MRSIYVLWFAVFLSAMISCKQDSAPVQENSTQPTTGQEAAGAAQQPANQANEAALSGGHDYTFLTDKLLLYKGSFGGKPGAEDPYKDQWIDFSTDGTYKAGKLKEQTHTGKWGYNHDTRTLFLRPDDSKFNMSEWKVQFNDQMLVWVGTQTYGNQATQIRLVRSAELP